MLSLADKGIRVNGVAPGPIWAPLIPASYSAEEVATFGKKTSHVPMDRVGQPCEVSPCYAKEWEANGLILPISLYT